nr:hypothetical protein Iba_chr08aCG12690 [Ipomoea batatas]
MPSGLALPSLLTSTSRPLASVSPSSEYPTPTPSLLSLSPSLLSPSHLTSASPEAWSPLSQVMD